MKYSGGPQIERQEKKLIGAPPREGGTQIERQEKKLIGGPAKGRGPPKSHQHPKNSVASPALSTTSSCCLNLGEESTKQHGNDLKYSRLSHTVLNILRLALKATVVLIIDETSMVSKLTLMFLHLRLSEIFNTFEEENAFSGTCKLWFLETYCNYLRSLSNHLLNR